MMRTAEAFLVTPGYANCGKCGGWQVLDQTKRRANGWPIGPIVIVNCDNCAGKGEVKLAAGQVAHKPVVSNPWGAPASVEPKVQHEPGLEINDIEWGPTATKAPERVDKSNEHGGWGAPEPVKHPGW